MVWAGFGCFRISGVRLMYVALRGDQPNFFGPLTFMWLKVECHESFYIGSVH